MQLWSVRPVTWSRILSLLYRTEPNILPLPTSVVVLDKEGLVWRLKPVEALAGECRPLVAMVVRSQGSQMSQMMKHF